MQEPSNLLPLSSSQREALEEAVATYQAAATPAAARWLEARGIAPETADGARLGVTVNPAPGHERYRGFLSIPYLSREGAPLSIRFRCLQNHDCRANGHGKYLTVPGDVPRMYNIGALFDAGNEIHVTEGEFDALILNQIGLPAVGIPGANSWKPHHRIMLLGFSRVWVWGDPDPAGAEFVNTVTASLRQARGVRLRGGDVTDTYLAGGAEALLELVGGMK